MRRQLAQIGSGSPGAQRPIKTMLGQTWVNVLWEPWSMLFFKSQKPPSSLGTVSPLKFSPSGNFRPNGLMGRHSFLWPLYKGIRSRRGSSSSRNGNYLNHLEPKMDQMELGWPLIALGTDVDETPTGPDWLETDATPALVKTACGPSGAGRALGKDCQKSQSRPKGQFNVSNIKLSPNFKTAFWADWDIVTS